MRRSLLVVSTASLLALFSAGCAPRATEPRIASSANESGYAVDFPAELESATITLQERHDELNSTSAKLDGYADSLDPKATGVSLEIVDAAEASARSWGYVERTRELDGVNGFFDAEGTDISNRVSGAGNYAAKQKGCDGDVGYAAGAAVKPAVAKSVDKRLRDRNEAFVRLERYKSSLPKNDVAVLEKMAEDVARASYLANVVLVEQTQRVRRLASDASSAKQTLGELIASEREWQAEAGRSDADKKASNERIDAAKKAQERIDAAVKRVGELDANGALDKQTQASQQVYANALSAFKKKLQAKVKAARG